MRSLVWHLMLADKAEHIHPHSDNFIDLVGTAETCTYSFNNFYDICYCNGSSWSASGKTRQSIHLSSKSGAGDVLEQLGVNIMRSRKK